MWPFCLAFVDIALHRRGPEDLPASRFLLGLVLAASLAIGLAALQVNSTVPRAAAMLLLDAALFLTSLWLVLKLFGKSRRFLQTATAMIGTDALLNLIALPLIYWDGASGAPPEELTPPRFLFLLLLFWWLDIGGYVLSKALARPYIVGVSIVIVYVLASVSLRDALFPVVG